MYLHSSGLLSEINEHKRWSETEIVKEIFYLFRPQESLRLEMPDFRVSQLYLPHYLNVPNACNSSRMNAHFMLPIKNSFINRISFVATNFMRPICVFFLAMNYDQLFLTVPEFI